MTAASGVPTVTTVSRSGGGGAERGDPAREVTLHDEHAGPRVDELVPQELALVGRVDRHLDGTELQRGEEGEDLLGAVLEQRRDAIPGVDAEPGERGRHPAALLVGFRRGEGAALEVEVRTVGVAGEAPGERVEDGGGGAHVGHGGRTLPMARTHPGQPARVSSAGWCATVKATSWP